MQVVSGFIFMSLHVDVGEVFIAMTQFAVYICYNHNYAFLGQSLQRQWTPR
jgi:hypothetical protein